MDITDIIGKLKRNLDDTDDNRKYVGYLLSTLDPDCPYDDWRNIIWALEFLVTDYYWEEDWVKELLIEWSKTSKNHKWTRDTAISFGNIWKYARGRTKETKKDERIKIGTFFFKVEQNQKEVSNG